MVSPTEDQQEDIYEDYYKEDVTKISDIQEKLDIANYDEDFSDRQTKGRVKNRLDNLIKDATLSDLQERRAKKLGEGKDFNIGDINKYGVVKNGSDWFLDGKHAQKTARNEVGKFLKENFGDKYDKPYKTIAKHKIEGKWKTEKVDRPALKDVKIRKISVNKRISVFSSEGKLVTWSKKK